MFSKLVYIVREIPKAEQAVEEGISQNMSLHSVTNYEEHVRARAFGGTSSVT
jgi:hypothetical protein